MTITGKEELIAHILEKAPKSLKKNKKDFYSQETLIYRKSFRGITFNKEFTGIEFKNCKFYDCRFENIWGFFFILNNCQFESCEFRNSRFSHLEFSWDSVEFNHCFFMNVQFDEGGLYDIIFKKCEIRSFNLLGFVPISNVQFLSCSIENGQFQSLAYHENDDDIDNEFLDLIIQDCSIEFSTFNSVDFINSVIVDTHLYKSSFTNCRIGNDTIKCTKEPKLKNYASIDFQSIVKSEKIDSEILRIYFHIFDNNLKDTITQITSKIEFKSIFISYSFKDKGIANQINRMLKRRGVKTFLWEKDAPGGQRLDDIMSSNIRKHDKILFISSQFSIKSKACQFEISQGRKKQEETWDNIFFPIHIDDFLFNVKMSQIRPIEKRDEYWENIKEIKRVNSVDFSKFNTQNPNVDELEEAVNLVVNELKLANGSA